MLRGGLMRVRAWPAWLLAAGLTMSGCIIGTWPTPEDTRDDSGNGIPGALGEEQCDGADDDADGSVDEGCPCTPGDVRGCIAAGPDGCAFGVQRCISGWWGTCGDLRAPFVPARAPAIAITGVAPQVLQLGAPGDLTVDVSVTTACEGIRAGPVSITLAAATPAMSVQRTAADDGTGGDAAAGDGIVTTSLPNAFGPGVAAQPLALRATTVLSGVASAAATTVALEAP